MIDQPPRPTIDLLLAPAAAGKTSAVVRRLREPRAGLALALVPGATQQRDLRQRLGRVGGVRVVQFFALAGLVLRRAGAFPSLLGDSARLGLTRALLRALRDEGRLPTYAAVAGKPGFVGAVAALLADLGNADIAPEAFAAAARTPHDAELAQVYRRYLDFQAQHGLADVPHRLLLACDALQARPELLADVKLLAVDGFDQFSPLQQRLLAAVARHIPQVVITLTYKERDRPAHRRFARTYTELQSLLNPRPLHLAPEMGRAAALAHIEAHLFDLDRQPAPVPADGAVTVIEAADREREVRAVLRHARRLIDAATPPREIAILFRNGAPYTALLREVAAEYQLPLDLHDGLPLDQAPPVATLLALLRLSEQDYPRQALTEVLRSPYLPEIGGWRLEIGVETQNIASLRQSPISHPQVMATLLDSVARRRGIAGGLERWRIALEELALATPTDADDRPPPVAPAQAAALVGALERLGAWVMPPERASVADYVAWVRERAEALQVDNGSFATRDRTALVRLERVLGDLARTAALLDTPPLAFAEFLDGLAGAVSAASYRLPATGGIVAMPALAARGLSFEHVAILGLSEGQFPQPPQDSPIYSRRERQAFREQRGLPLPAPDPADEYTIFYETIARARRTLTLARTRLDERGDPLPRSPYLTALLALVDGVETITVRAGSVPSWEAAASPEERALALADALSRPPTTDHRPPTTDHQALYVGPSVGAVAAAAAEAAPPMAALIAALRAEYPAWDQIVRARAVEAGREGLGDYGPFEGAIDDPALIEQIAGHFGPEHRWSVTQLNDYITCPFRFAAAHALRLAPRPDTSDALDAPRRGQLYHAILARAGERWRDARLALTLEHEPSVLAVLDTAAREVLDAAPERLGFTPSGFWSWERDDVWRRLRAALRGFIRAGAGDWQAFAPAGIEQRFGERSRHPPLRVETPTGAVLIEGRIDRVDQRADGALAVVDYKSSGARTARATLEGRDLQLPIYILAIEQVIAAGRQVERAAFFQISSGKPGAELQGEELRRSLEVARASIAETIVAVRAADFRVRPRETCPDYCEFEPICRRNLEKRRRHPPADEVKG